MPLSPPPDRQLLHSRDIDLRGYQREDGLFDIEAHLVDTKSYDFENMDRGLIPSGEPVHGMWIRLTIDQDLVIQACEATMDYTPYTICPGAAPNFARLAGLKIGPGFNRAVNERVGGVHGCTHLREVLAQMATVAYQTLTVIRRKKEAAQRAEPGQALHRPPIVGTCLAYAPDSPVTAHRWPEWAASQQAERDAT
ncbi:DUF2889 domain-containing protein [Acetobacteraceae bacterium H6797]|nr:DUF2889 domain-containing protein [Acetobacteraceae bacterium H6797]